MRSTLSSCLLEKRSPRAVVLLILLACAVIGFINGCSGGRNTPTTPSPSSNPSPIAGTQVTKTKGIHVVDDLGDVNPDPQQLYIHLNEEATWFSDTGNRSTITFDPKKGSPFKDDEFHVPAGGSVSSGPIKAGANGPYKYTVQGKGGKKDPVIIIDN